MNKPGIEEVRGTWELLAADPVALATRLIELLGNAEDELVRVHVARVILDRIGLRRRVQVPAAVLVDTQPSPPARRAVGMVIERLAALRASQQSPSHAGQIREAAG